jgi:hypothetical protein
MHPASAETFQALLIKMETEWTHQMMEMLKIDEDSLPIIWDADFLYGRRAASGEDTYVLCAFGRDVTGDVHVIAYVGLQFLTK